MISETWYNRRVYVVEDGRVTHTERDDHGVTAVGGGLFAGEVDELRQRFVDYPVLMAGMVGSTVSWRVVLYVPVPAGLDALAAALDWIDEWTAIVPASGWRKPGAPM